MSGRSESAVSRETPKQHTSAGADQIVNDDDNFTAPPYAAISSEETPPSGRPRIERAKCFIPIRLRCRSRRSAA